VEKYGKMKGKKETGEQEKRTEKNKRNKLTVRVRVILQKLTFKRNLRSLQNRKGYRHIQEPPSSPYSELHLSSLHHHTPVTDGHISETFTTLFPFSAEVKNEWS
jgi:hypothetical protein